MASTTTSTTLSMKLVISRKTQRVLFAEASKDVVDFLFSFLALPVATAVKLLGKDAMVGCIGDLYAGVEKLDSSYIQPGAAKEALLCPTLLSPAASTTNSSLLSLSSSEQAMKLYLYRCNSSYDGCKLYVANVSGTLCPYCSIPRRTEVQYVREQNTSTGGVKGFVQGVATYTVLDNLTVSPMSATSSITLLNTFAVRDIGDLQEKTVKFGYNEGLAILKASLQSKTVLTDVFLRK
ncbi:hypothetical protein EJB05_31469, partial [Eragrostis curvula]